VQHRAQGHRLGRVASLDRRPRRVEREPLRQIGLLHIGLEQRLGQGSGDEDAARAQQTPRRDASNMSLGDRSQLSLIFRRPKIEGERLTSALWRLLNNAGAEIVHGLDRKIVRL
jgi:hypothetical protein